ncbi:transketolase family protein [Streptomonospora nanhaiensis]|uniref:transketolase family protein n=1 Tax=Streptomonospora nanhaiensis TaxID=1323731 RepID=UPI001C99559A|nr:transketolase C-terminal domain-containing protein [Streptomonospora nanhaiensis]MBX9386754.1 transketolase [Streptomonospora nanhaiensis]
MRDTFAETVSAALDTDPRLAVVLADISADRFARAAQRHPDRVINLGIREQLLIGAAGGLALAGMRPVAHTFAPFLIERPFEQVKLDLGHQGVGAVLVSIGASYDGAHYGRTHMAPGDVALLDTLPDWTVQVPGHATEVERLLRDALAGEGNVYVRLTERGNAAARPVGAGLVTVRAGSRRSAGVVVAVGPMLDRVLAATEDLDVTVAYTATVRPFDREGLNRLVAQAGHADVLVVEPYLAGTSAHEVAEALGDRRHRQRSLGVRRDTEVRGYGTPADHDRAHGLDTEGIAKAARDFFLV